MLLPSVVPAWVECLGPIRVVSMENTIFELVFETKAAATRKDFCRTEPRVGYSAQGWKALREDVIDPSGERVFVSLKRSVVQEDGPRQLLKTLSESGGEEFVVNPSPNNRSLLRGHEDDLRHEFGGQIARHTAFSLF